MYFDQISTVFKKGNSFSLLKSFQIPLHPPFSKGEKPKEFSIESPKALLPLKKGGREGFLARPFQSAKGLPSFEFKGGKSC